ncbi:uncharacterized protein LOC18423849 isoform X2 [Amborella trichopoda]|uniref:uncharacterized protein LOC18423849 isoform X2 n=1 Tax=Amborella trichopoda TaxID=13333 RepID=UPI0009C0DCD0|nr:uncharacterized protein LOC18423849 isoform X2 [Amborella trichopoda]|eukprot:XP_020531537.1 uncharacterized protein LOC18423849 isoform X2 [Amborella trichopoda]
MAIVTGDRYLDLLVKFTEKHAESLLEGTLILKLNPVGLHYVHSRLEALEELEGLIAGAPVDYLRAYISDLGDHRALEQLRRILRLLTSLKVVSVLPPPARDPAPLSLRPFNRLRFLELRGCDLSTSQARGLLELRHTLEKIICHNSTDALRHVFAGRIVDIRDCPLWNRLSFVSCSCNGLVLMDESLQLLPVVETLDLSHNSFAKVDNLWRCTKLRYLDLGFNHLRTIASLKELQIDGRALSAKETWKMQILVKKRQKRPAGFGFYSRAKEYVQQDGSFNRQSKKSSRLACIEDAERKSIFESNDHESGSCDSEQQRIDDNYVPEDEAEVLGLMNRIELMKKERSILWLREFKDWMDHQSDGDAGENSKLIGSSPRKAKYKRNRSHKRLGEISRYVSDLQDSEDESSTNILESDTLSQDNFHGDDSHRIINSSKNFIFGPSAMNDSRETTPLSAFTKMDPMKDLMSASANEVQNLLQHPDVLMNEMGSEKDGKRSTKSMTSFDEIMESRSSSVFLASPPHYREDILHRRQNLEEEFMQLSAGSYTGGSSDSDTSSDDTDSFILNASFAGVDQTLNGDALKDNVGGKLDEELSVEDYYENIHGSDHDCRKNGGISYEYADQTTGIVKVSMLDHAKPSCMDDILTDSGGGIADQVMAQGVDLSEVPKRRRKPKTRVVSLPESLPIGEISQQITGVLDTDWANLEYVQQLSEGKNSNRSVNNGANWMLRKRMDESLRDSADGSLSKLKSDEYPSDENDDFIRNYFCLKIADPTVSETCQRYVLCSHLDLRHHGSGVMEREIAVLLSSENKLYLLSIFSRNCRQEVALEILGIYRLEAIKEVVVGMGLQILRLHIDGGATYLLITETIEKSKELLALLQITSNKEMDSCRLISWEQVQVNLLYKHICGGMKMSIVLYSLLLFWQKSSKGKSWLLRSLFVMEGCMLLCTEEFLSFGSSDPEASPTYFSSGTCCSISNIVEMVIEPLESRCITLTLGHVMSENTSFSPKLGEGSQESKHKDLQPITWRLKWFSEDTLFKFVALVNAIYAGMTMSTLPVKCMS